MTKTTMMADGTNASWRERLMGGDKDYWWGWITILILAALITFGVYAIVSGKSLEGAAIIIGALITKLGTLIDYMYGNSKVKQVSNSQTNGNGQGA